MDPKPVRRARPPGYPTKQEALEDPTLLDRHLPPAFRRGREIAGAATLFLAMNFAACDGSDSLRPEGPPGAPAVGPASSPAVGPASAVVAPLFEHGEGRGVTGCVAVSPPVFLSEEEALQVITEELGRHGLSFPERNLEIDSVRPPRRTERYEWVEDPKGTSTRTKPDGSRVRGKVVRRLEETRAAWCSSEASRSSRGTASARPWRSRVKRSAAAGTFATTSR